MTYSDFRAVHVNLDGCYGPAGSKPLGDALAELVGNDDVEVYRNDGFAFAVCPVLKDKVFLPEGSVAALGPDGELQVFTRGPANRFSDIRQWAEDRNLIEGSNERAQMLKLVEEMGELAAGLARNKQSEIWDAIGDMVVVLTIMATQTGIPVEDCIEKAWAEIKDRKGRMVDGVFIKETDA